MINNTKYMKVSILTIFSPASISRYLLEIPSAKEVESEGINLGEMNALLLKKIEELTLYLIEQDKRSEKQESRIKELERLIKP